MHFMTRRTMRLWCAALALGCALCWAIEWGSAQLETGEALCADTLRLHVRADSDSLFNQTCKLLVRDAMLTLADEGCPGAGKEEALTWAARCLPRMELAARNTLAGIGVHENVQVRLVEMYFAAAHYAGASLPAGRYEALRVEIGDVRNYGRNWWCVLYPGLCRAACGGYALPEENDLVCGDTIVRFKLIDWWQTRTSAREDEIYLEV